MELLWWRIYFGLNAGLLALAIVIEFYEPTAPVGIFIADVVIYSVALLGVFSYFSKKHIFEPRFWKYFFWFNVIYTGLYVLYAIAPDAPYINSLAFLNYGSEEDLLLYAFVGTLLGIPYLYAMYQLSKGKYLELKTKEQELKEAAHFKWGMLQTALWGYAIVFLSLLLLLTFIPSAPTTSASPTSDSDLLYPLVIFSPILIFWLWVAWQHKMYQWNWWRVTLLLNSILFSSIIVFGSFFYEPVAATPESSEIDVIGLLQFLIIFIGLFVFGREQFAKRDKTIIAKEL